MKIPVAPLQKIMPLAIKFVDKKNVVPVTGMVKLDFRPDSLGVTTTNYTRSFTTDIAVECDVTETVLIDANRFHTFISQVQDEYIDVTFNGNALTVKRKGGKTQFARGTEVYPTIPLLPDIDCVAFDADVFGEILSASTCGTDEQAAMVEQWKALIHIEVNDDKFQAVASDKQRIVLISGECKGSKSLQLPIGIASILRNVLTDKVEIYQTANHIFIKSEHLFVFRRASAELHKDLAPFLSQAQFSEGFSLPAEELSSALGLVRSLMDMRLTGVRWTLAENVTFSTASSDGSADESLDIKPKLEFVTGFNINWLLAILRQLSGEITCEFLTVNPAQCLQIRRQGITDTRFIIASLQVKI